MKDFNEVVLFLDKEEEKEKYHNEIKNMKFYLINQISEIVMIETFKNPISVEKIIKAKYLELWKTFIKYLIKSCGKNYILEEKNNFKNIFENWDNFSDYTEFLFDDYEIFEIHEDEFIENLLKFEEKTAFGILIILSSRHDITKEEVIKWSFKS